MLPPVVEPAVADSQSQQAGSLFCNRKLHPRQKRRHHTQGLFDTRDLHRVSTMFFKISGNRLQQRGADPVARGRQSCQSWRALSQIKSSLTFVLCESFNGIFGET